MANEIDDNRVVFDFEIDFSNGGGIQGQGFRLDIEGDDGWSTLKVLKEEKLPIAVSKGYLLSQKNGVTRLFRDYIETKGKPTFDDIGSTVIIPTSVIVSIKKINLS